MLRNYKPDEFINFKQRRYFMNDAKKIYNCDQTVSACEGINLQTPSPSLRPKKLVLTKIAAFFMESDLDLATFERLESKGLAQDKHPIQKWHGIGGRF